MFRTLLESEKRGAQTVHLRLGSEDDFLILKTSTAPQKRSVDQ